MATQRLANDPWSTLVTLMAQAMAPDIGGHARAGRNAPRHEPPRRGLIDRIENWFWRQRQRATERWLAQSSDVFELEARMRALERPWGARYY